MDAGVSAFTRAGQKIKVVFQLPDVVADAGDQAVVDTAVVAGAGHQIAALGRTQRFFMGQVLLRIVMHSPEQHIGRQRRVADEQATDAQVIEARGIDFDFIRKQIVGLGQRGTGGNRHRGGRGVEGQKTHAVDHFVIAFNTDVIADLDRRHAPRVRDRCIGVYRTIGLRTQGIIVGRINGVGACRAAQHCRRGINTGTLCRQTGPGPRHPTGDAHRIAGD